MYSFESRIRYSETGADGLLTPEKLIDYFQDCSTFQSEDAGAGVGRLRGKGLAWIIVYWRVEIRRMPALGEEVRTGTIPYSMKGAVGQRNFFMETQAGEQLARANSVWTLVDTGSMRPVRVPPEILEIYPLEEKLQMQYDSRKIRIPDLPGRQMDPVKVREYHLDSNYHMNNGQYVRIAAGFLPERRRIRVLRIEYRQQARLGDSLHPVLYTVSGAAADAHPAAGLPQKPDDCTTAGSSPDYGFRSGEERTCIALNAEDGKPYAIIEAAY